MIIKFKHKGLKAFFQSGEVAGIQPQQAPRIRLILTVLNVAAGPPDMNLPGFGLHPLKGNRKGQWAVSVSGNWRIVFIFIGSDASDVDLIDYH